jgi:O-acetyl-ADP-ribose deacetylase (regulator of RNase III)
MEFQISNFKSQILDFTGESAMDDEWLPSKIVLIDQSPALVEAWRQAFATFPEVEPLAGDYFQRPADAMISPANSFGIMDGGLDLAIRDRLGHLVQKRVQDAIREKHHGELPVGCAEIVETDRPEWKYLVAAPTMRVPESVAFTLNAYLAFRAALVAVENFNRAAGVRRIGSLVCCGLGTGVGGMSPARCAAQMQIAYKTMIGPPIIGRFESIHAVHQALRMA